MASITINSKTKNAVKFTASMSIAEEVVTPLVYSSIYKVSNGALIADLGLKWSDSSLIWEYGNLEPETRYEIRLKGSGGIITWATQEFTTDKEGNIWVGNLNPTNNSINPCIQNNSKYGKRISLVLANSSGTPIQDWVEWFDANETKYFPITGLSEGTTYKLFVNSEGFPQQEFIFITGTAANPNGTVTGGTGSVGSYDDYNLVKNVTWDKNSQGQEASNKHFMSWAGDTSGGVANWQWAYYIGSLLRMGTNPDNGLTYFCDAYTTIKCTSVDNSDPDFITFKITPGVVCHNYHGIPFHDFKIETEANTSTSMSTYAHYKWDRNGNWRNNVAADGSSNWYRDWPVGDGWAYGYTVDLTYKKPVDGELSKHCTFTLSYPGAEVLTDFPEGYKNYYFSNMSNKINLTLKIPVRQCNAEVAFGGGGIASVTEVATPSNTGPSIRVDKNTQVKFLATPDEGYEFIGWFKYKDKDSSTATPISTNPEYTQTITEDTILFAKFKLSNFEIKIDKDNTIQIVIKDPAHSDGLDDNWYRVGDSIHFTATLNPRTEQAYYTFDGWYIGSNKISSDLSFDIAVGSGGINQSCTVIAKGIKTPLHNYSVVKTDPWVGTSTINGKQSDILALHDAINLVATPTANYKFVKWVAYNSVTEVWDDMSNNSTFTTEADEIHYKFKAVFQVNGATCSILSPDDGLNVISQSLYYDKETNFTEVHTKFIGTIDPNEVTIRDVPYISDAKVGDFFFMLAPKKQ